MNKVRQIGHPNLVLDYSMEGEGGYQHSTNTILLNLECCKRMSDHHYKMDVVEFVAKTISHEFLHHLFRIEQDIIASIGLDNLIYQQTKHNVKKLKEYSDYGMW